ncbi:MAG: sensor histidine kinase, partial [Bacteroidia bacterium]|nr:sensor histidine kinase [Bacteroidia bacterium]
PMRLSVQHLVRTWASDKPANEKLNTLFEKVTRTILVQVESLVNIANSFSQFANMPEPVKSKFPLQAVIQEVVDLYANEGDVQLELDMPVEEFYVHSDRDQLSRVFNNLIKNGKQAIEHEQGLVLVKMTVEGDLAKVMISDNGKGIPEEIGSRIFEPRFSTKSSGMGLGLAIVKKIVEGAEGRIYFESEVGKGTRFFVELPRG